MKAFFRGSVRARLLAGLGLTFVACGAGLPHPTNQHLNIAKQSEPNVSLADLERGRSLYVQKCGSCHALRAPQSLAPEQWRPEIEKMRTQ
ncbi:MAG TPA: cytochrome c [Polyangiaceae bacterium]|nr:cytochrome c [Polyangiaceae bacterium]